MLLKMRFINVFIFCALIIFTTAASDYDSAKASDDYGSGSSSGSSSSSGAGSTSGSNISSNSSTAKSSPVTQNIYEDNFKLLIQTRPPLSEPEKFTVTVRDKIEKNMKPKLDSNTKGKLSQIAIAGRMSSNNLTLQFDKAQKGQFQWQTAIAADGIYFCSGSLLTNSWVLTAASCVDGYTNFTLIFGTQQRNTFEAGRAMIMANTKYLHPSWTASNLNSDIALLYLPIPIATSGSFIVPIRLPRKSDADKTFEGVTAFLSGWGRVSDSSTAVNSTLMSMEMTVSNNMDCSDVYGTSVIISTSLCARPTKSSCNADTGSPLVYKETDGVWTQIALVSFTASSGCQGQHVGYTRVASFLGWISNTANIQIRS